MVGASIVKPVIPLLLRNNGATGFQIGLIAAFYMLFRAIFSTINGIRWDKNKNFSKRISFGFLFLSLIFFIFFFKNNFLAFLILRSVQGMISGGIWPIMQLETMKNAGKRRGKAISLYYILGNFGSVLGILLCAPLLLLIFKGLSLPSQDDGLRYLFIVSGSVIFFLFLLSGKLNFTNNKQIEVEQKKNKMPFSTIFTFFLLIVFANGMVSSILNSIIIVFIKEFYNFSSIVTTLVYGLLIFIASVFLYLVNIRVTEKNWQKIILTVIIIMAITLGMFYFPLNKLMTFLLLLILFTGVKTVVPLTRNITFLIFKNSKGKKIGLLNSISNIGSFFGPLIGGIFYDIGKNKLFAFPLLGIIFFMIFVFIYIVVYKKKKENR